MSLSLGNFNVGPALLDEVRSSLVRREPVMVAAFVTWLLANVGAVLLGHTHLVTASQWTAVATYLFPLLTAVLMAGLGKVLREQVAPAPTKPKANGVYDITTAVQAADTDPVSLDPPRPHALLDS